MWRQEHQEVGQSSVRVQVRLDLAQGGMQGPWLQAGREAERSGEAKAAPLPPGQFSLSTWTRAISRWRRGARTVRRGATASRPPKAGVLLIDKHGQCWDLVSFLRAQPGEEVDVEVCLGKRERVPVRLLAKRVGDEQARRRRANARRWVEGKPKGVRRPNERHHPSGAKRQRRRTRRRSRKSAHAALRAKKILITNVPQELLSLDEGLVLARCRWQIELLWKLWKQVGKLDTWRSAKPYRILTEIYAKLLGLLISHWLTLLECWHAPNRRPGQSPPGRAVDDLSAGAGSGGSRALPLMVQRTSPAMASGCTVNARRKKPATYQLVDRPKLIRGLG